MKKCFFFLCRLFCFVFNVSVQYGYIFAVVTVRWRQQNRKSSMTPCMNTSMDLQQCLKCFLIWGDTYTNAFSCLSPLSPCTIHLLLALIYNIMIGHHVHTQSLVYCHKKNIWKQENENSICVLLQQFENIIKYSSASFRHLFLCFQCCLKHYVNTNR